MLTRCVLCASLTFDAGGHCHLEQPPSAMSWQEPEVQSFISTCRCYCTVVAACHYDRDWSKRWMFCTSHYMRFGILNIDPREAVPEVSKSKGYINQEKMCL